jgi:hypothetical protein
MGGYLARPGGRPVRAPMALLFLTDARIKTSHCPDPRISQQPPDENEEELGWLPIAIVSLVVAALLAVVQIDDRVRCEEAW